MRVLVLHSELGVLRGGGENFTRNLFGAFAGRGHYVAAAFIADQRHNYPIALPPNIKPFPLGGWWSRNFGQALLSFLGRPFTVDDGLKKNWDRFQNAVAWRTVRWHNRRFRTRIEREFRRRWDCFDAVYVHGDADLAAAVTKYRPTILRLPGPLTVEAEPKLRTVHAVCANGDALTMIQRFLGNHATELPVGLDDKLFRPGPTTVRSKIGWSCQHTVIGYVGRLTRLKGVDLLAAAFREISEYLPDARLLIIGRGEEECRLRSMLSQKFSRRMIHIEPDVDHEQLAEWYRAMDILVMPSRYENFSNALIEAMACGIPFLASDVGGNKIVATTGAGWLFNSDSVSALSTCLRIALQDTAEQQKRGKIGFEYTKQHHSWAATAERLEEILACRLGVAR
jgi:glycosyltransferase involved in cell wall biosynthesis